MKQVKYLGFLVGEKGISIDLERAKAIKEMPRPTNAALVLSFLGLASYFRKFIPRLAEYESVLRELTQRGVRWRWSVKEQEAFDHIREQLANATTLQAPKFDRAFHLYTDASLIGCGCVLAQLDDDGDMAPVAFASWSFDATQMRYSTTERELLGLIMAIRKFQWYFTGRAIECFTDHKPLIGIQKTFADPYGRIQRWLFELACHNVSLNYVQGPDNISDVLSRLLNPVSTESAAVRWAGLVDGSTEVEHAVMASVMARDAEDLGNETCTTASLAAEEIVHEYNEEVLAEKQRACPDFRILVRYLEKRELPRKNSLARIVLREAPHYVLLGENKILMRLVRFERGEGAKLVLCVPRSMRAGVLQEHHDYAFGGAHMGRLKTMDRIGRRFFWPGLNEDVASYVKTCHVCQEVKRPVHASESVWEAMDVGAPGKTICIDLWGPIQNSASGYKHVLTAIDPFTKHVCAVPLRSKDSSEIAEALISRVFPRGVPERVVSDND